MLNYEKRAIRTEYVHLGDVINIIQHNYGKPTKIVGNYKCWCCGNELKIVSSFILKLLPESRIRFGKGKEDLCDEVKPTWSTNVERRRAGLPPLESPQYHKAADQKKIGDHIVCSFSTRSGYKHRAKSLGPSPKTITKEQIASVLDYFGARNTTVFNLGDDDVDGTISMVGRSLEEKYELVASAKYTLSTDNGIAHLALMTQSNVFVVHKPIWNASLYYPAGTKTISTDFFEKRQS